MKRVFLCSIDASSDDGSLGRLVNDDHISPNCEVKKIVCEGKPHLCLFAIKKIFAGEEITYNYGDSSCPWHSTVGAFSADCPAFEYVSRLFVCFICLSCLKLKTVNVVHRCFYFFFYAELQWETKNITKRRKCCCIFCKKYQGECFLKHLENELLYIVLFH